MPKCVYCGKIYDVPRGLTMVMNDGRINYLCSSKCRKNMHMKRRKVRWIRKSDQPKAGMAAEKQPEKPAK
jgi:ribosomal protein L24E